MGGAIAIVTSVVRDAMDPSRLWALSRDSGRWGAHRGRI